MNQLLPKFKVFNGPAVADPTSPPAVSDAIAELPGYDDVIQRYPELAGASCVFLSGSLISGWGNERSDLDIFVIAEKDFIRKVIPESVVKTGRADQDIDQNGFVIAMGSLGGLRADIEFWTAEHIDGLIATARPRDEAYLGRLGRPTYEEQDLLHRLSMGRALSGQDWLDERKRRIAASDFAVWIAENYKVAGENQLDDLVGMFASGDIKSAVLRARDTYLSALQAVLAYDGDLSPGPKWIAHRLARAEVDDLWRDEAWRILTMGDCADEGWPMDVAHRAHGIFLTIEQRIVGHAPCGCAAGPDSVQRRLGVRTYRHEGDTIIADITKCRTGETGGYIWALCDGKHTEREIAQCLARDLALTAEDAAECVASALRDLRANGLVDLSD